MTEGMTLIRSTKNLFLTMFMFAFFFSSWLVVNVAIGEAETWVSAIFIVILAVPSYYYIYKWAGPKKALVIILIFSIVPIVVESIGISTGFPYGGFHYTDRMGFKIFGLVPWSVAFAFAPLVLGSLTIASRLRKAYVVLPLGALILVIVDLVLDPAAVVLNIWEWDVPGPYYGIPIINYTGWFLTAFISTSLMHLLTMDTLQEVQTIPSDVATSLLLSLSFWTGFTFWIGFLIPTIIGTAMLAISYHQIIIQPTPGDTVQDFDI